MPTASTVWSNIPVMPNSWPVRSNCKWLTSYGQLLNGCWWELFLLCMEANHSQHPRGPPVVMQVPPSLLSSTPAYPKPGSQTLVLSRSPVTWSSGAPPCRSYLGGDSCSGPSPPPPNHECFMSWTASSLANLILLSTPLFWDYFCLLLNTNCKLLTQNMEFGNFLP